MSEGQRSEANDAAATASGTDAPSIAERTAPWQRWAPWVAVLVSAGLVTLSFPPADIGWLAWLAYAPFLWALLQARRPGLAAGLGYVFGVVHFAAITTWLGVTVSGWAGSSVGWIAWVGLAAIQGLWYALFGYIAWWVVDRTRGDARLLLLACAWTVVEHLRTLGGLAMPWALSGYTQYRALTMIQISEITGFLGVGFLIALVNAALASLFIVNAPRTTARRSRAVIRMGRVSADVGVLVVPCLFYAGALTYGMLTVGLPWNGRPVMVSLIQPNMPSIGSQPPRDVRMGRLAEAVHTVSQSAPSLVVWPESVVDEDAVNNLDMRTVFSAFANMTGGYHLVGTGYTDERGNERNSAALFAPDIGLAGRYDKQQLVPFGEWVPARGLFKPFAGIFRIPEKDLVSGGRQKPLVAREMRLGVLICYESIFPALARDRVRQDANLLVSITNDSWAGRSASPMQHFAMSVFRAVETRRTLCAAGLTGITGIVEPSGHAEYTDPDKPAIATDLVYLREGLTPYARWGDWFPYLCAILVIYGLWQGASSRSSAAPR
jgi:apolipoprotein N-acyltransferase